MCYLRSNLFSSTPTTHILMEAPALSLVPIYLVAIGSVPSPQPHGPNGIDEQMVSKLNLTSGRRTTRRGKTWISSMFLLMRIKIAMLSLALTAPGGRNQLEH